VLAGMSKPTRCQRRTKHSSFDGLAAKVGRERRGSKRQGWLMSCASCASVFTLLLTGCSSDEEEIVTFQNPLGAELLDDGDARGDALGAALP
jgi:hypothetical protein